MRDSKGLEKYVQRADLLNSLMQRGWKTIIARENVRARNSPFERIESRRVRLTIREQERQSF